MKESLWGYLILILGVIVTTVMLLVSRVTTHAEEDYYLARETMQAALLDSIDYAAYRSTGRIIISKSKFIEIYVRRFAESVTNSQDYQIDFYDIYEEPPKASVRIRTTSGEATVNNNSTNFSVDTLITGILETNFEQYLATKNADGSYNEGKYITVRFTKERIGEIPENSSVTLIYNGSASTSEEESQRLTESSCKYNGGSSCDVFYNGKQYRISRNSLTVNDPKININDFNETLYKYCEYPVIKSETTTTIRYLTKYISSNGIHVYKNGFKDSEREPISKCTKVEVEENCDYGPNGNMCKTKNGRYISKNYLTSTACSNSSGSNTKFDPKELENLEDLDKIKEEINKNKAVLILLDFSGVNELGDPETGFYYKLSDKKMYRYYNVNTKAYNNEITKIKMPTKGKTTCVYKYNGKVIIDKKGNFDKSQIDNSMTQITLKAEC